MRTYDVYCPWGCARVVAEELIRVFSDDKLERIKFVAKGRIIAEFYAGHIAGWVEVKSND